MLYHSYFNFHPFQMALVDQLEAHLEHFRGSAKDLLDTLVTELTATGTLSIKP